MAEGVDLYETLGVRRNASETEIKKAYKSQAMRHHPDRNKNNKKSEEKFKRIQNAYAILSDEQKRARYDQFGVTDDSQFSGGSFTGSPFSSLFGDLFSSLGGHSEDAFGPSVRQGRTLEVTIELSLEEAARGCKRDIRISALSDCTDCDGSGMTAASREIQCAECNGTGVVHKQMAIVSLQQTCPRCRGAGKSIKDPCPSCSGSGRRRKRRNQSLKIPAGINHGDTLRMRGKGEAGSRGAPAGDLMVVVQIKPHEVFVREGNRLTCEVPISFGTATLGGKVRIPTMEGFDEISIPKGCQSGQTIRVKGAGIQSLRNRAPGDLYCSLVVETPQNLSRKQEELLRQFENSLKDSNKSHSPKSDSWLDKAKRMFN